jgi:ribosomal protein S18 acetylase RimI-like enzyme
MIGQPFELRRATPDDAEAMLSIMHAALASPDFSVAHAFPSPEHETRWLAYLASESSGCWIAQSAGRMIGFSAGAVRGQVGWLALLCVEPGAQGQGVGRSLLRRSLEDLSRRSSMLATLADAAVPRPLQMYLRSGLIPCQPFLAMAGPTSCGELSPDLALQGAGGVSSVPFEALEQRWMQRPATDHSAYFQQCDFEFRSFWNQASDCLGYAYWTVGARLGPLLAIDDLSVTKLLSASLAEMADCGLPAARLLVPADNRSALNWLQAHAFELQGMEIACASAPLPGAWDRYLAHRAALP